MNNFRANAAFFLIFGFLVQGCATGAPFQPVAEIPDDKALVYIYRPGAFFGGGVVYDVHVGETEIVALRSAGYFPYFAIPGETEFWARTEAKATVATNLEKGETYYLRGGVGIGFFIGHPKLTFVSEEEGASEIQDTTLLEPAEE